MAGPQLIVYPITDVERAKRLFTTLLGTEPYAEAPYYVGYRTEGLEIGLDPNGSSSGPIAYWETEDIAAKVAELTGAGWQVTSDARDVGGGMLIAQLSDDHGSTIGLRQSPR
jgi:predicted enzyme related to lactoylglutathione lyase